MKRNGTENEMGDRPRDDTREPAPEPRRERAPGGYYYDDRTGYEVYNPAGDENEEDDEGGGEEATSKDG